MKNNIAIYRKYRPQSFVELVGQIPIVQTLSNAVKTNRVAHAYLFTGPRGTGKTTVARILAKTLNCENRKEGKGEPCLQCQNCIEIKENRSLDLTEIDAASNTGVDNIREIIDNIKFVPSRSKHRVYIIDEVHMLSKGAFNALLKTLEEPPIHAIFILATTEIHKVPATILSRCQRFDFERLKISDITKKLENIAKMEDKEIEKTALDLIAMASEGCMRDAESLLGRIMTLEDEKITFKEVENLLGLPDTKAIIKMLEILANKELKTGFEFINELTQKGSDMTQFLKILLSYLQYTLRIKIDPNLSTTLEEKMPKDQIDLLTEKTQKMNETDIVKLLNLFLKAEQEMKYNELTQLPIEMAMVEYCKNSLAN